MSFHVDCCFVKNRYHKTSHHFIHKIVHLFQLLNPSSIFSSQNYMDPTPKIWIIRWMNMNPTKLQYAQHQYLSQRASLSDEPLPKLKSAQTWATNLCKRLMHLALNRWQIQNEAYHDSVSKFGYTWERQHLILDITTQNSQSHPDHTAVNRLMSYSIEDLVTGTNSTMITWKTSFDLVMKFINPSLITSYLGYIRKPEYFNLDYRISDWKIPSNFNHFL